MNFFDVGVEAQDSRADLKGDGFSVTLSGGVARRAAPYNGKRMVLGIRPEHLSQLSQGEDDLRGELPAIVDVVESMGSEQYAYLTMGSKTFVARLSADVPVKMGDQVRLAYPKSEVQLFDSETERSVLQSQEPAFAAV